ncbi:MAG: hypothetical protein AAFY60_05590, partial [Myxococcota bacterium]
MTAVAPVAFTDAIGRAQNLGPAKINAILPALVKDLTTRTKAPSSLEAKAYLEARAQDLRDRADGNPVLKTTADRLEGAAN